MNEKEFKIFVDFDGTITKTDVGDAIFREFGAREEVDLIIENLLIDKISAKESWLLLCKTVKEINKENLDNFINKIEIDKTFIKFVDYCRQNNFDFFVLSDGFDYYIERIFEKENLHQIKYFSNRLSLDKNKFTVEFPYEDIECRTSANCKRNHIINNSSDDDFTFYIGDGNSDKYTAQFCDFIFAKDDLLKYCEKDRISFFPYKNFEDVIEKIEVLKKKKRLKKRHQAELKRREVYLRE